MLETGKNQNSSPRINMPDDGPMNPEQNAVYQKIVNGKRGKIVGPLRPLLYSPELADRVQSLGEHVRYDTSLPQQLSEFTIICVGRYWNCQIEWSIHADIAVTVGVDIEIIEAIRKAQPPALQNPMQIVVYEFTRELLEFGQVSELVYKNALSLLGEKALVELTGIIGYYTLTAMTLNAHHVPLTDSGKFRPLELPETLDKLKPTCLPASLKVMTARK